MIKQTVKTITISLFLLLTFFKYVNAQQLEFQIHPSIIEIESEPGETITHEIKIKGTGGQTYQFNVYALAVTSDFGHFTSSTQRVEGLDWISFEPKELTFSGYEEKKTNLLIDIPREAKLADYYLTISFERKNVDPQQGVNLGGSIEIPLLITVAKGDEPKADGQIKKFVTPYIDFNNPIRFDLEVENSGGRKIKSFGKIEITNKITGEKYSKELLPQNILVNSSRVVVDENSFVNGNEYISWQSPHLVGIYSAKVDIYDKYSEKPGSQIITSSEEKFFIYFNIYLLLTLVLVTLSVILFILQSKSSKKKEKNI
jgi:hypothetical protein